MGIDLPLIWAMIIAFGVMMYVIMDGFDLGIGILFPFIPDGQERDTMINTVAPVWDGNETWLVLGGAAMFAAFPLAYGLLLSALYLPLMLMLAALIWRGISFEFRFKADARRKPIWDRAFAAGSYIATFSQGVALGAFINGFKLEDTDFVGGPLDCITPFSVFTGFALMFSYGLLGSTWLVMKTDGDLQQRMKKLAQRIAIALLLIIAIVSVWTPLAHPQVAERWFSFPNILMFSPVPALVLAATILQLYMLQKEGSHAMPFCLALAIVFLGYSGLAISLWPNIVPPSISIWSAAAPTASMAFALVGTMFIIPVILVYTTWSYYVFRGKHGIEGGYE
ncbi:cytochrome d ubiquinol oxidase subunit II [Rhizobium calliandrae]|uniref:Cytochrome d ubiquinol oxidase subunit II n=1 Tax=Rhizobium calliandrae TaxID=1312182 RepID=A0ABT7KGJ2_9HYPH|nr:cytochrome d ubiquinol oxidase subunit II [Rhizobium calliandrae]MDL2407746.1 cytochrome d ubiquinol oxidase subunit II [Rhizobium calliandrae]